ncbi:MAG: damage-control phosphatase ARMT1 family protein [Candidatus Kryptoniota bacterium]
MKLDPECIPCVVKQAYTTAKLLVPKNAELQFNIIKDVCRAVDSIDMNSAAPMFSSTMQSIIEKALGVKNPYKNVKEENIKKAERFIKYLEAMVNSAGDKLEMALRIAIMGNTIDLAANPNFSIEQEVNRITANRINSKALMLLRTDLQEASTVLYIGDNYEEALFDKILLEQLKTKKLVFAVRSYPILNDITLEDARNLGIDKICSVIESGSRIAGTDLGQCTPEFIDLFDNADVVIAKGQGNYETLMDVERRVYFLFKVKCEAIARRSGLSVGASALYLNS